MKKCLFSLTLTALILTGAEIPFLCSAAHAEATAGENILELGYAQNIATSPDADKNKKEFSRLVAEGRELYRKKRDAEAAEIFTRALKLNVSGEAYYYYGNCLMNLARYEDAVAAYYISSDYMMKFDRKHLSLYNTACAYSLMKNTDKAHEFLTAAVLCGYSSIDHISSDNDLLYLRKQKNWNDRYRKLRELYAGGNADFINGKTIEKYGPNETETFTFTAGSRVEWTVDVSEIHDHRRTGTYKIKNYNIYITWSRETGEEGYGKTIMCASVCSYEKYRKFSRVLNELEVLSYYEMTVYNPDWWKITESPVSEKNN